MIFQMLTDWPVNGGALIVPAGATLEANLANPDFCHSNGTKLPDRMPLTAMAMDQDAYDAMCDWHGGQEYLLRYGPGVTPRRPGV